MSYQFKDIFLSLLPKGEIYKLDSFVKFTEKLAKEFDRAKLYIDDTFFQTPDSLTDERIIRDWEEFLSLPDDCSPEQDRQKAILSRLSEYGGGSLSYLKTIASRAAGRKLVVKNSAIPMIFEVIGISIKSKKRLTSRSPIRRPIRLFSREDPVICAVERVKHAHIDSRYYDKERTNQIMHRIDTQNATSDGLFTDGDPHKPEEEVATYLDSAWLNAVQEEICKVITENEIELKKGENYQLGQAISKAIESKLEPYKIALNKLLSVVKREIEREGDGLPENI